MNFKVLCLIFAHFVALYGQKIEYLSDLYENDECELENGAFGVCKAVTDCLQEYELYRKNQTTLRICTYNDAPSTSIICCPKTVVPQTITKQRNELDLTNFETCRNEFLQYRKMGVSINHFAEAFSNKIVPNNQKNCDFINKDISNDHFWQDGHHSCREQDGKFYLAQVAPAYAELVRKGDRPNIAAIGWTQKDKSILYNCGGSIITERYIVTAAHCRIFQKKEPDLVRLGDRYLLTSEDDEIAQQVRIEKFISHPDYTSAYHYNDIAMIKTLDRIVFNKFVVPSCIADLDAEHIAAFREKTWTVAGYGETEDRVRSNILLELKVKFVPYKECNETFSDNPDLPRGIADSQLCVKSIGKAMGEIVIYPDTCFGDSGSPLQYKTAFEVFPDDFNKTFLSHYYFSSNVIGIVSFGVDCSLNVPSVYTKLAYYRDWMKNVVQNN
ncbi:unnamed protein product [Chironomus riparius]|uniref:Peptidase S1 domain-containing protein n=1 Tax=Chironomus riparius TaxID=315576 RepID=A0A9N9X0I5_9DIPT|nr:unnamed protein product [Chironomus riparius]